jgi:hypothetical protein
MALIAQSPFEWLAFDGAGALTDAQAPGRVLQALEQSGASDLVVISHGWKTDQVGAGELYSPLWANVTQSLLAAGGPAPGKIVVAGVLWPSKPFQQDFDAAAAQTSSGGTLSIPPTVTGDGDLSAEALDDLVAGFKELVVDAQAGEAVAAAVALNADGFSDASAKALLTALKAAVGLGPSALDPELEVDAQGFADKPADVLSKLAPAPALPLPHSVGAALGLGDALTNAIQGSRAAVGRLLNQFTYFAMKQRAGVVGQKLGAVVLPGVAPSHPTRLHLIGHSFGARLVTAAAAAFTPPPTLTLKSLTLLQGAYSHNGLSSDFGQGKPGAFASVLASSRVHGPITMTHTRNDSACTIAYPLASRLSRDVASDLGDANDLFGAMGANGAQHLPTAAYGPDLAMVKQQPSYVLAPGLVNRVLADTCVSEHMDVTNADVGALVASVLRTP